MGFYMYHEMRFTLAMLVPLLLLGCGGSSGSSSTGSLTLQLTDAPVDNAEEVWIQFRGVEIHGSGASYNYYFCKDPVTSETITASNSCVEYAPKKLNLLALTNGISEVLLNDQALPTGSYQWVRLMVDAEPNQRDSYIVVSGAEHELEISSGDESGLKLNRGFDVTANGTVDFTIDFDLRKSVNLAKNDSTYKLRPTLRLVDNTQAGTISGTINSALVTSQCGGGVYVYSGHDIAPDDIGASTEPLVTALIKQDVSTGEYKYKISFVEAGDYTIAYTCDAAKDAPDADDDLVFSATTNVTLSPSTNLVQPFN